MSVAGKTGFQTGVRIVPASEGMDEAVARLRNGQLVAFPTETVYGLGANALDPEAVARIFATKGRPANNPLIVHVAHAAGAASLAGHWPETAALLAAKFWPGPLTLVLTKSDQVPSIVTAGGGTVGLRVPDHPVAQELLRRCGLPIAAPSANRSEEVSPTTAQHVADSLGPHTDDLLILDGGPCAVGVESTVVDTLAAPPCVLRPGMLTESQLAAIIPGIARCPDRETGVVRSPGQAFRHYAPKTPLGIVPHDLLPRSGDHGLISIYAHRVKNKDGSPFFLSRKTLCLSADPKEYAQGLYAALRTMDSAAVDRILVEEPPAGHEWEAIHDRLRRAASRKETTS